MTDEDCTLTVVDEEGIALRIGRMVLSCARVEFQLTLMATQVGVKNAKKQSQGDLIKAIRKGCQAWPEGPETDVWLDKADALLRERGMLVHGSFAGFLTASGVHEGFFAHKTFKEANVELNHLDELVEESRVAADQGESITARRFDAFLETVGDSFMPD